MENSKNNINYIKAGVDDHRINKLFFHFLNLFNSLEQRIKILVDICLVFLKLLFCLLKENNFK